MVEVAIHDHADNSVTIGHVADSTAALGSNHGGTWNGVALTRDHKPNLKDRQGSGVSETVGLLVGPAALGLVKTREMVFLRTCL